jgi:hypothetical protein
MNPNQYGLNFTSQEDYENEYNRLLALARRENISSLIAECQQQNVSIGLKNKIKKFINRYGFFEETIPLIVEKIIDSELLAAYFIIEPTKQNFYENTALKFLYGILGYVDEDIQLPNHGPNAFYIIDGILITGLNVKPDVPHKSIDFRISIPNTHNHIYISHKHTNLTGGTQNQAYADLNHFISQANINQTSNYFVAIADGKYYENIVRGKNNSRLHHLINSASAQNNTYATNIFGFRTLYNMIVQRTNPN